MSEGMEALLAALASSGALDPLLAASGPRVARVPETGQAYVASAIAHSLEAPVLLVAPAPPEAERLAHGAEAFLGRERVALFPAWEALPLEGISPSPDIAGRRALAAHRARTASGPFLLIAPVAAAMQRLAPTLGEAGSIEIRAGEELSPEVLGERLVALGYVRADVVEHRGEFAVRGGIVDVFPAASRRPVRLDYDGDLVETIRPFSPSTQLTTGRTVGTVEVHACRELVPDDAVRERAAAEAPRHLGRLRDALQRVADGLSFEGMEVVIPLVYDRLPTLSELLPEEAWVVLAGSRRTQDRSQAILREAAALADASGWHGPPAIAPLEEALGERSRVDLSELAEGAEIGIEPWRNVGQPDRLAEEARSLHDQGFTVALTAGGRGSLERMREIVPVADLSAPSEVVEGFVFPAGRVALLAEDDLFGRRRTAHVTQRFTRRRRDTFVLELTPGDLVVHDIHGVARYGGMVRRTIGEAERDYLILEYAAGDRLYVPTDMVGAISKYIGGEAPRVSRLGSQEWPRAKGRVRRALRDMAGELVRLYSARLAAPGHAFGPDTPWQRELEEAFPFTETPDQASAIEEVKRDMESPRPMDRLICGDVGYGKTEIAVRAAFKAVMDGKQVAVLVPTTLLAEQHFVTFSERYAPFPVRVAMLSRFLPLSEQNVVLKDLAEGKVDVIVGTHRLLSGDARFKDLGLLVVDEEQRFGVAHKERIKRFRTSIDVLTMTATPIPRTLEMALAGIREISVVDTPPEDRQPVHTYVGPYDETLALASVRRELLRDGQVFWVHNRVRSIDRIAGKIAAAVPDARVVVAHGQMDEDVLESAMLRFWDRQADVLVCTTIIESGLDVPSANTLVIDDAHRLGLSQLYQLRGRVGRSPERAFAYMFFPPARELTEEAYARLATISEHTALGSGFRIALRDLEIRGAGNLLGAEQHGQIAAVGFDTYVKLLGEAVAEQKGEPIEEEREVRVDLPVKAFLPQVYVGSEAVRLDLYRRIASSKSENELAEIREEIIDRFGPLPEPVDALLEVVGLRVFASALGVDEISTMRSQVRIRPVRFQYGHGATAVALLPGATYREASATLNLPAALSGPALPRYVRDSLATLTQSLAKA